MRLNKKILVLVSTLALVFSLCGCAESVKNTVYSAEDIAGKTVGVMAETVGEKSAEKYGLAGEVKKFYDKDDLAEALISGELDCAVVGGETAEKIKDEYGKLKTLDEAFSNQGYRIAVPTGNGHILEMLAEALEGVKADGVLDEITGAWLGDGAYEYIPAELPEDAGTVTVGVSADLKPYEFIDGGGQTAGLEIDLIRVLCDRIGVKFELVDVDRSQLIYLVESGKVSFAIGRISDTDSDSVNYTDTYYDAEQYVLVRK